MRGISEAMNRGLSVLCGGGGGGGGLAVLSGHTVWEGGRVIVGLS
jgi:hypothetical protein